MPSATVKLYLTLGVLTYYVEPGGSVVKDPPANAGDVGLIPGSGRFPRGGHGTLSSLLAWRIPWTEEPGGLQSTES